MLKTFKIIAFLEGCSLLLLLFVAMPMKYILEKPEMVRIVGMGHGILFLAYIFLALMLKFEDNWSWKKFGIISIWSIIPFGTFIMEKKYL